MLKDFVGNKRNETNVFQLCCGKGKNYVGYVGLVGKTLFENYVEMVAGLPRTNKKWKYFVNQTKERMASTNTLKTVKMQC